MTNAEKLIQLGMPAELAKVLAQMIKAEVAKALAGQAA